MATYKLRESQVMLIKSNLIKQYNEYLAKVALEAGLNPDGAKVDLEISITAEQMQPAVKPVGGPVAQPVVEPEAVSTNVPMI